jgi:hypothetical protein
MATAMGDMVVGLGVDESQLTSGLSSATTSLNHFERASSGLGIGASRSFRFLGHSIQEAGDGIAASNSALGDTVGSLGGMVSGIGEAVHGYHALHVVMDLAIAKQLMLNLLSPIGWITLAAAALAAGGAYLYFSGRTETAQEKAERLKKTLGELASMHGEEFDRTAAQKRGQLAGNLEAAEGEHVGLGEGILTLGLAYWELDSRVAGARTALAKFDEALKAHAEQEASKHVDETLDRLRESAAKLDESPLQRFQGELAKSGRSAAEAADAMAKFQQLSSQEIDAEIAKKNRDLSLAGLTKGERFVVEFKRQHEQASEAQMAMVKRQGEMEDLASRAPSPVSAIEFGSSESYAEIARLINPENSPDQRTAENTAQMLKILDEISEHTKNRLTIG